MTMISAWMPTRLESPTSAPWFSPTPTVRLSQWIATTWAGGLFLLSLFLIARRLAGALQRPLEPVALIATASVLTCAAVSIRLFWLRCPTRPAKLRAAHLSQWLPTLSLAIIGVSVTLPGSSVIALTTFWLILMAAEGLIWGTVVMRLRGAKSNHQADGLAKALIDVDELRERTVAEPSGRGAAAAMSSTVAEYPPEGVSQQVTRSSDQAGRDSVHAWLRGAFAAGQRSLSLHVAFCPPLNTTPEVEAYQLEGATAKIKIGQVMPYGARIDLRLEQFSEQPESVLIELDARQPEAGSGT